MEMSLKQAQNIAKQRVQELRAWEKVEAVLNAALGAELREVQANERVRALTESAGKWEVAVERERQLYAIEAKEHQAAMELKADAHTAALTSMKQTAEEKREETDRATAAGLVKWEGQRNNLTAECRALEEQRETLKDKLIQAQLEYAAMLDRLGVKHG